MGKVAYLILAHKNPDICNLLIEELLTDTRSEVYLHIDVKFKNPELFRNDVHKVRRYDIDWGSAAMVYATLELIREAYLNNFDRYVLLSGDTFPLRNVQEINDYLLRESSVDYMELYEGNLGERGFDRVFRYWVFKNPSLCNQPPHRQRHCNKAPSYCRATCAAVALNNVAVNRYCMFTQFFHVDHTAQCTPNQARYFCGSIIFDHGFMAFACAICAWQH